MNQIQNHSWVNSASEQIYWKLRADPEASKQTLIIQIAKTCQSVQLAKLPIHKTTVQRQERGGGD